MMFSIGLRQNPKREIHFPKGATIKLARTHRRKYLANA
jgi:hypothetical protein